MVRALLPLSMVLGSFIGCSGGEPVASTAPEGGADAPRDTLVIAYGANLGSLISPVTQTVADSQVLELTQFPIMDSEFDCSLKRNPGLATAFTWSEDGKTLSMTLRDDIKWSDGKPVTAEDIAFTYDLIGDPKVASPRSDMVGKMAPDGRPKIIDPTHIEWHFTSAYDRDTQGAHANFTLVPKHALEGVDRATLRGADFGTDPKKFLSSGPFKLSAYEPNQKIVLEPNESYTGPADRKPHLQRVIMRIIPDYNTRLLELEKGTVDMLDAVRVQDADKLKKEHPEIKIYRAGSRKMDYVGWNITNPLFADKNVRRALAAAVDVPDMMKKVLGSESGEIYGQQATGTITPELCGAFNADIKPIPFSADESKKLFATAGWTDSNGDGVLDKNGQNFEFDLLTGAGNARRADVAVYVQSYLKNVGVKVNIVQVESNTLFDRLRKHDFQAAVAGWSAALYLDPSGMWATDKPDAPHEFNFTGYANPEVDAIIEKGLATPNPEDAAPLWKDLQAKVYDDQPYLFLWWMDELVAVHGRFENVHVNVGSNYDQLWGWRVPADKVKYKLP
jgi:peptide/nickel transport system substrate-binding protein